MVNRIPTLQRLWVLRELLLVLGGGALYLALRIYQNAIAAGQMRTAVSISEAVFDTADSMNWVLLINLLLDIPFVGMGGLLVAVVLATLKPRSLLVSGCLSAVVAEVTWLHVWGIVGSDSAAAWIVASSRLLTLAGLVVSCLWINWLLVQRACSTRRMGD